MRELLSPIISVRDLTRVFSLRGKDVKAVNLVSLDVYQGEFLAITGRSGSGKTTLLNLMAGLDQPTAGAVLFEERNLHTFADADLVQLRRHKIGFVFQSFGILPLLSAYENVELPLHLAGVPRRERQRRALEALDMVGLGARARHRPFELSGGEQQRVAIARALVNGPAVIFADEPTGELDTITAEAIAVMLRDICLDRGITIVAATHDRMLTSRADRIVELTDGALTAQTPQTVYVEPRPS